MNFTGVTIWHKKGQEYKRLYFDTSTVTEEKAIEGSAAGELSKNSALIRLYALYECGISVGDKLCVGYDEATEPPEGAYIIGGNAQALQNKMPITVEKNTGD